MSLSLTSPPPYLTQFHPKWPSNPPLSFLLFPFCKHNFKNSNRLKPKASSSSHSEVENVEKSEVSVEKSVSELLLDSELLNQISSVKNADEVLMIIREESGKSGGVVSSSDCSFILKAAFDKNNVILALLVYDAMQSSFHQGVSETGSLAERWKWDRPDVLIYSLLVRGLASALRVSDAIRIIYDVCQIGVYSGEEVSFGKVVRCPSCMIAVAVAQPQHGIQIASCSKCRYQYELFSGNIITIESEQISMDTPAWERGLRFLNIMKQSIPAAVHSIVVQTPSGIARTHKFATKTVKLPAQEGERVTISLAAPSSVYREVGPLRLNSKAPGFNPGEAMCLTNHTNGQESELLRAPVKNENLSISNPSILFPVLALLTTGNFATGMIDPTLPQFISIAAVTSIALGTTINSVVLPQLNRLPQRMVDVLAIKQQLLSQYDLLQNRIKGLREAAEKEVWMLARMCQLENKIVAVGEPSYRARRSRIKKVRESLESSLIGRIELIDSYAKISSMIEIEVEMDSDVIAAETASNAENIAEQIEQIMELENLEEKWKMQAEANDEVERLLSSQPIPTEQL